MLVVRSSRNQSKKLGYVAGGADIGVIHKRLREAACELWVVGVDWRAVPVANAHAFDEPCLNEHAAVRIRVAVVLDCVGAGIASFMRAIRDLIDSMYICPLLHKVLHVSRGDEPVLASLPDRYAWPRLR